MEHKNLKNKNNPTIGQEPRFQYHEQKQKLQNLINLSNPHAQN